MKDEHMSGKYLSVLLTKEYFYSFQIVLGRSAVISCSEVALSTNNPEISDIEKGKLLAPLKSYLLPDISENQPLDYYYLRLVFEGLNFSYQPNDELVPVLTRKIGKLWWFGGEPLSIYLDRSSLKYLISPFIQKELDQWKYGSKDIDHNSIKSPDELALLGINTFIEEFQRLSNINCSSRSSLSGLDLFIEDCPFCASQSSFCHVFLGVMDGLLDWLHGPYAKKRVIVIDEKTSTSHFIKLRLGNREA